MKLNCLAKDHINARCKEAECECWDLGYMIKVNEEKRELKIERAVVLVKLINREQTSRSDKE